MILVQTSTPSSILDGKSRPEGSRSRSENEGLDYFADGLYEIESGDVRDGKD